MIVVPLCFQNNVKKSSIKAISNIEFPLNTEIEVNGWVRSRRTSKGGFSFIEIHDGSCFQALQAIADKTLDNYSEITELTTGCAVTAEGRLVMSPGKTQDRELQISKLVVVGKVEDTESYPISKKRHTFEYLRSVAHLRPRTNTFGAVTRVRNAISQAVHEYFSENEFVWISTPIITGSDCEGAGELFRVSTLDSLNGADNDHRDDFFGRETFLTVSGQLNVEPYCLSLSKVYTFGPTFRAENSNTSRHLAEFWMIEPEIAFADLNANAALAEDFLKQIAIRVINQVPDDMNFFQDRIDNGVIPRLEKMIQTDFVQIDYSEAVSILKSAKENFEYPVVWGIDLQSEHERYLTEKHVDAPVIVVNYPKEIKAFYMRVNDDEKTVAAMDVLVPGVGEIIGGSQREERLDILESRMNETLKKELWWYSDLRRYGTVPHAGFGLGLERLVLYMTGMENIRDVIPYPRVPNNASF